MSIRVISGFVGLLCVSFASAQSVPPALMVPTGPGQKVQPLGISKVDADIRIAGPVAQTRMTLTFTNPHNRVLSGDLYFPLPEGATVCGYALDIDGRMVDGVAVEKHAAREVFEKIVRRGIDPGLVEWTKGNNFKTRVFPIPARGSRTVRIDYLTEVADGLYRMPLNFKTRLAELHLRVDVAGVTEPPTIQRGPLTREMFKSRRGSLVAESTFRDTPADKDLIVALPERKASPVAVEKAPDGSVYFVIQDSPPMLDVSRMPLAPKHVVLFWDASGSRAESDLPRQLAFLKACLRQWGASAGREAVLRVDLVAFRDVPTTTETYMIIGGNAAQLLERLGKLDYDGGTQIGALAVPPGSEAAELVLLFSDGLSTFGRETPAGFKVPVYAVSAGGSANHSFLHYLASTSGGQYLNLARLQDAEALSAIGREVYGFLGATGEGTDLAAVAPSGPAAIAGGRFLLAGKLTEAAGKVTLRYGRPGGTAAAREFAVSAAGVGEGTLLQRFWAQKKLADLLVFQERNREAILSLGKEHGLVTPFTSLLVLDSLEQYVENKIAPPRSLPEMREEYMRRLDTVAAQKKQEETQKIEAVLTMWKGRQDWWKSQFKYPKDFKYKAGQETPAEAGRARDAIVRDLAQAAAQLADADRALAEARVKSEAAKAGPEKEAADRRVDEAQVRVSQLQGRMEQLRAEVNRTESSIATLRRAPAIEGRAPAERPAPSPPAAPPSPAAVMGEGAGGSSGLFVADAVAGQPAKEGPQAGQPGIAIKEWDPKTPYLEKLKSAKPQAAYGEYMRQRGGNKASPAYFLDCANFFFQAGQKELALRVLSNIAEMELENPALLRVLGQRLSQAGELDLAAMVFEEVLKLRPEEPQSYRDLALVLAERKAYARAIELLNKVVMGKWDERFAEIELTALIELNAMIVRAGIKSPPGVDARLIAPMDMDMRIVMTWDADATDMDLHVIEPSGEEAFFSHNRTTIGGLVSRDFTRGYGPEEYLLRKAMTGSYTVQTNYFGSSAARLIGPVTLRVDVYTNYGRPSEKHKSMILRLTGRDERITVGQVEY